MSRFEEAFQIITTLIRHGAIDFDGSYYTLREMELKPGARPNMKILVGSNGPRMLRVALPHAHMWNSWFLAFGNRAEGLPQLTEIVDDACRDVGKEPSSIERTVAVYVKLSGDTLRVSDRGLTAPPISGTHEEMAREIQAFEGAGISHIQVVLDPITADAVEELAEIVRLIR